MQPSSVQNVDLRAIPSVDELLGNAEIAAMARELGHDSVVEMLRRLLSDVRAELAAASPANDRPPSDREELTESLRGKMREMYAARKLSGVRRVINATGVIVHTNLGRAPLSEQAIAAMTAAAGYSTIEFDIEAGKRGARGPKAVSMIRSITSSEDALIVNNCAAAAMLVLSVFAKGREVLVSRGELVEIGGDFRIPDVLERAGAIIREVGTTNRTHLRDYRNAITERTAMVLKVHPSNYRITGFTTTPETGELAGLAREFGLIFYEDAGSGAMIGLTQFGVKGEPVIKDVIAAGADLVSYSGDKLFGGPQSGIIAGRADLVGLLRKDPFYRALRVDKTVTAAIEGTLGSYAAGTAEKDVPVLKMLAITETEIEKRAKSFVERFIPLVGSGFRAELIAKNSAVGGGASPDADIKTTVIALAHDLMTEAELERRLRLGKTPVVARIENERVLIDLRTVGQSEEEELASMLAAAAASGKEICI